MSVPFPIVIVLLVLDRENNIVVPIRAEDGEVKPRICPRGHPEGEKESKRIHIDDFLVFFATSRFNLPAL